MATRAVIRAIQQQAATLAYANPFMATEVRARLGAKLAEITPGDIDCFFFTNGGAEANENAIRIARAVTGRPKVLARYRSYHGATAGAISLTGDPRRWGAEPGIPGIVRAPEFHKWGHKEPRPVAEAPGDLEDVIRYEGAHTIAAFILEPVVGTNGLLVPPDGYMQGVRALCDTHGILLDRRRGHVRIRPDRPVVRGGSLGRRARPHHDGQGPDVGVRAARGGRHAAGTRARVRRTSPFPAGLTYNSHPLGCAAALATIEVYEEEALIERAARMGELLREARGLAGAPPVGGRDARRSACSASSNWCATGTRTSRWRPSTARPTRCPPSARSFREQGLYTFVRWNTFFTNPPLVITEAELDEGFEIIDRALEITDRAVTE